MQSKTAHGKVLKNAETAVKMRKKCRFNQDLEESIKEIKEKMEKSGAKPGLSVLDVQTSPCNSDLKSRLSLKSRNTKMSTLTREELKKYFKDKKDKVVEDSRSRISFISKKSLFNRDKSALDKF